MITFEPGQRYSYLLKNTCYELSLEAIKHGNKVRYGISESGEYYFEIIDPFEKCEMEKGWVTNARQRKTY